MTNPLFDFSARWVGTAQLMKERSIDARATDIRQKATHGDVELDYWR